MKTVELGNPATAQRSHHGFVNAVHVVDVQMQLLERLAHRRGALGESLALCELATKASSDYAVLRDRVDSLSSLGGVILESVGEVVHHLMQGDEDTVRETVEVVDLLVHGLVVTELRLQELLQDSSMQIQWHTVSVVDLISRVREALGMFCLDRRWDVVYARDDHNDRTHLVEIAVTSRTAEVIRVPKLLDRLPGYLAFAAVLRTRPGGRIEISVADTESGLVLSVRDNGKPMDADRIEERVRAAVETGDPTGEDASFAGVVLAVSSLFASRSGGSCSINVASSGETEALVVTPSGAAI